MEEKVAIECSTKNEWDKVQQKAFDSGLIWISDSGPKLYDNGWSGNYTIIYINKTQNKLFCGSKQYCSNPIISAAEYLNEGGKDVSEFKKGDRVECTNNGVEGNCCSIDELTVGEIYTIKKLRSNDTCELAEVGDGLTPLLNRFKLVSSTTKTQTTKENNMNISDNILTVFEDSATTAGKVAKRFGSEYGDTTRDRLALERDKTDLLKIIAAEEKEAKKDK